MTQSTVKYTGLANCISTIVKEEGLLALYKGVVPRVINISLGGAIFFGAYEAAKNVCEKRVALALTHEQR